MFINCFDEHYYILAEGGVKRIEGRPHTFTIGDIIPSTGATYEYPENFNVLDLESNLVGIVRKSKLQDIIIFTNYEYDAIPFIESKGSALRLTSQEEFQSFRIELEKMQQGEEVK